LSKTEPVLPAPSNGNQAADIAEPAIKAKRLNPIKRKKIEDRIQEVEAEISRTENLIAQCETGLQAFVSAGESQRQSDDLERHKSRHASLLKEWEELSESLQEAD
jgi:hypothetical protein